jgi:hypothetical protein
MNGGIIVNHDGNVSQTEWHSWTLDRSIRNSGRLVRDNLYIVGI